MAVGDDDWLVADSEDEEFPPENGPRVSVSTRAAAAGGLTSPKALTIQTEVFAPDQPRTPSRGRQSLSTIATESLFTPPSGGMDTTISNFTSVPPTFDAPSVVAPNPRPRPRIVMKKAATSDHNADVTNTSFSHISDRSISGFSTTTRTNDSIHPGTSVPFDFSGVVGDAYSSLDIADRAKMRSRKSQTAKKSIHPPAQTNTGEVIELTSDEDELVLKPLKRQKKQGGPGTKPNVQTRPRPKPKLKVKPAAVLPSCSPPSRTVIQDPQESSAQCASSSHPPASTLPTIPPSTPPQARELTPISSPPVMTRKRKRVRSIATYDDEMDIIGGSPIGVSPSSTMPPPFFAPSSSSVPTDSGIEIPPVDSLSNRARKKQVSSGKKETQKKAQNKGRKGKKAEITSAVDEAVEESAGLTQQPSTLAMHHSPSFANECHSSVVKNSSTATRGSVKQTMTKKGKARATDSCEEEELVLPLESNTYTPPADEGEGQGSKENLRPDNLSGLSGAPPLKHTPSSGLQVRGCAVKPKMTPMTELIRRVNSQPSSPFPNASRTYSPLLKSSRTMLSRIAPLHPHRRTPPPPLPRPPPPKKSKKQLQLEERIDEELAETIDGWSCLTDDERKAMRKARIDAELGYE